MEPKPKPINDVTPPSETAPSASSRPIIVSNKPQVADPMLAKKTAANEALVAKPVASEQAVTLAEPTKPLVIVQGAFARRSKRWHFTRWFFLVLILIMIGLLYYLFFILQIDPTNLGPV